MFSLTFIFPVEKKIDSPGSNVRNVKVKKVIFIFSKTFSGKKITDENLLLGIFHLEWLVIKLSMKRITKHYIMKQFIHSNM